MPSPQLLQENKKKYKTMAYSATFSPPWRVEESDLEVFPSYYTLERSHTIVYDLIAPVISGRISEFARINSLFLDCNAGDKPYSCQLSTDDFVALEINLWKVSEREDSSSNIGGRGIIVEVRRRSGDCLDAQKIKNQLFRSIKPKTTVQSHQQLFKKSKKNARTRVRPSPITVHAITGNTGKHQTLVQFFSSEDKFLVERTVLSVSNASDLIKLDKSILNGIQLLEFLSSDKHKNNLTRGHVNTMILTGMDPFGREHEVMSVLHKLAVDTTSNNKTVHRWAVKTIGNALLDVVHNAGRVTLKSRDLHFWKDFIPPLLQDMKNVEEDPHLAYYAVRCLRGWIGAKISSVHQSKRSLLGYGAFSKFLKEMVAYGKQKHANLEKEARVLLSLIGPITNDLAGGH